MPNALHQLTAYRKDGLWMFDDPRKNIFEEPFVAGADIMFDDMSGRNKDTRINRCQVVFASTPIPETDVHVELSRSDGFDGHFYVVKSSFSQSVGFEFWLCPALLAFFPKAPKNIFVKVIESYAA